MRNHSWASNDLREQKWALGKQKSKERFHVNNKVITVRTSIAIKSPGPRAKKMH